MMTKYKFHHKEWKRIYDVTKIEFDVFGAPIKVSCNAVFNNIYKEKEFRSRPDTW